MILDTTKAKEIAREITELLSDEGYPIEEIIPGLLQGVYELVNKLDEELRETILDEAANFLADGGVICEDHEDAWDVDSEG